jgi:hypothetical protein
MSTTVEGIVKQYPQMQQGNGQNGQWYKQEMIVETYGQYPKLVRITFMNEKIDGLRAFPIGSPVKVSVNLESKEYNGKWYDSINGWKVDNGSQTAAPAHTGGAPAQNGFPMPAMPQSPFQQPPLQQVVDQAQQNYQAVQAPVTPVQAQYQVGQIVNGYQMQADGSWLPAPQAVPAPAPMPAPIQNAPPQQAAPQNGLQGAPGNWDSNSIPF